MAAKNAALEYDFVEEPSQDYFCPITFELLKDPQQMNNCCGNHLSRVAAERLKREGKPCPMCGHKPLRTANDVFFRRQVMALKVRCNNKKLGCTWVGALGELEEHVRGKCEYVCVSCPYKCGNRIQRRLSAEHKTTKCVKRPFTCQYCMHKGTYEEVTRDHWPQCQRYPVKCPNKCCEEDIERRFLKRHLDQDCPLQEIECKFSYAGCGAKIQRRGMQEHTEKSKDEHIDALATHSKAVMEQLQSQVHALSVAIVQIAPRPICVLPPDIVLENFERHKKNNDWWYSPSFYSHVGGYKMCLGIACNGRGSAKDTHVSVFLHMMRGEFDDHLQWPFKGIVTVQLINQKEGGEHVEKNVVNEDDKSERVLSRVVEGDVSKTGWGWCEFIRHSDLYKPEKGKEYLKNDILKFKFKSVTVKSV